jgi:glycerophosphocholine phosphodiesterase GPCPD1
MCFFIYIYIFTALVEGGGRETEEFGLMGGLQQVERGWLSAETVVQLKMFNDPIKLWKRRLQGRQV